MTREADPPVQTLALEGPLNVFSVQQQWARAEALLAIEAGEAVVDLTRVSDVDATGIQLLCTLDQVFRSRGVSFRVLGVKEAWK